VGKTLTSNYTFKLNR